MSEQRRRLPYLLQAPEQGWSSLLLLLGMLGLLGISIANARPLPITTSGSATDSFVIVTIAAGLVGYILARSALGVVRAHIIGAAVAAFVLLMVAGGALLQDASALPTSLAGVSERIGAVWARLDTDITAYLAVEVATPTAATFLVLGAICWATAQFAAFSVFRYDRGGPAVMAIGTVLFLNIGLAALEPEAVLLPVLPVLAIFSALAMLLLMRMQLLQQRLGWARRHISDTGEVSRLFLRSGVIFVVVAVVGATSLTTWATIDAQDVSVDALEEPLEDFGDELARLLSLFGVPPLEDVAVARGQSSPIADVWTPGVGTAFSATIDGQLRDNYWFGWADETYDRAGKQWLTRGGRSVSTAAGDEVSSPSQGPAGGPHRAEVTYTVGDVATARVHVFRPSEVNVFARQAVTSTVVDEGGSLGDIIFEEPLDAGEAIRYRSFVRDYSDDATSLTANELRAAGEDYPAWALEAYLQGADDELVNGPNVQRMARRIERAHPTAYGRALAVQRELGNMDYVVDLGGACDAFSSVPECVLEIEEGFCQHYATTMVMVLREMDIPARFVTGYLPGTRSPEGVWTVPQAAFHNWAEAYFPEFGWVRFDPTPGRSYGQERTDFQPGPPVDATPTPEPGASSEPLVTPPPTPEPSLEAFAPFASEPTDGQGNLVIIASTVALLGLLLTVVSVLLLYRLRRLPSGDDGLAYRGIVSLATRLGYGPSPSQTEYEYAGTLSEVIPGVREDLYVVAEARVETAYGQRQLDAERHGLLRSAYARIRTALLRLSLRRR